MINELKEVFGLEKYEALLLSASVKLGIASLSELANETEISRTAAYVPIKKLKEKGLLSVITVGKRKKYQTVGPKQLRYIYQQKKLSLEKVILNLSKLSERNDALESNFRYFSGVEGIKIAYSILVEETKSKRLSSFDNSSSLPKYFDLAVLNNQIQKRVKKNIALSMISAVPEIKAWMRKYIEKNKKELRETIFVSYKSYPFETSIVTDGSKTLVVGYEQKPFALLICNKMISNTLDSIHSIIWNQYRV